LYLQQYKYKDYTRARSKQLNYQVLSILATFPDEELSMEYDDSTFLSWKEMLSLTNNYDKVNSFLVENNVLISLNYILSKAKYFVVFRRGRTAIERQVEI
jgi:hypothetical protein